MPVVADIRDAIRNNKIFHNRFNPALEIPETKKYYAAALKDIDGEKQGYVHEDVEDQDVLALLVPGAQAEVNRVKKKIDERKEYLASLGTRG